METGGFSSRLETFQRRVAELRPALAKGDELTAVDSLRRILGELSETLGELRAAQEEMERQKEALAASRQALAAARAALDERRFDRAAHSIFHACKGLIGASAGWVCLLSGDGGEQRLLLVEGPAAPAGAGEPTAVRGLAEVVHNLGRAVFENNFPASAWSKHPPAGLEAVENVLAAPLMVGGRSAGMLGLANKPGGFTHQDARLACEFADLAAMALASVGTREALADSDERFRAVGQAAKDAIVCADAGGNVLSWNDAAAAMFGYTPEEIVGRPLVMLMPRRLRAAYTESLAKAAAGGALADPGRTHLLAGRRKDGGEFPLELRLSCWRAGEEVCFAAVARDVTEQRRAEEEAKGLARFPAENPGPILRVAAGGELLYANPASEALLKAWGCEPGQPVPADMRQVVAKALASGSPQSVELAHEERLFSFDAVPVAPAGYVNWYGRDITLRRRAETELDEARRELEARVRQRTADLATTVAELEAEVRDRMAAEESLRRSEARLAEAQRIAHLGNWDWDIARNQLWWSEGIYHIFGLTSQQFAATHEAFLARVHPDDRRLVDDAIQDALFRNRPYAIDHRIVQPDGTERIVHQRAEVYFDERGRPTRMAGTFQDITGRKRAEQTAEFERRRLYGVLRAMPGYVALIAEDYAVRFANDGFLDLFGPPGDAPCYRLQTDRDQPCEGCLLQRVLTSQTQAEWEHTIPNGRTFQVWAYPFTDVDGERLVLKLGIDITERKRLMSEILKTSESERQRIGQDLHDSLGQVLSGASCMIHVLRRRLADKALAEADDASRIETILADSVALTRSLAHGLNPVGAGPESLPRALRELADSTERMFRVRCQLRCDISVPPIVNLAALHLYRIAQEAVHNAVRHGKAGQIVISLSASGGQIALGISDDGTGLPDNAEAGEGMGLRTMRYRADHIGAKISFQRRPEGGTAVVCLLPTAH